MPSNVNHANTQQCVNVGAPAAAPPLLLSFAQVKLPDGVAMGAFLALGVLCFFLAPVGNAWNCAETWHWPLEYDTPPELSLSLYAYVCVRVSWVMGPHSTCPWELVYSLMIWFSAFIIVTWYFVFYSIRQLLFFICEICVCVCVIHLLMSLQCDFLIIIYCLKV